MLSDKVEFPQQEPSTTTKNNNNKNTKVAKKKLNWNDAIIEFSLITI